MQVLLLAQPVQERSLLLEEGLPRREEHRAADVQPDPLPVAPPGRVDDRAVTDALRRRPARFRRGGRGGGRVLPRLVVFVVVVIIVIVILNLLTNYHFRSGVFKQKICVQLAVTIHFLTLFNKATVMLPCLNLKRPHKTFWVSPFLWCII